MPRRSNRYASFVVTYNTICVIAHPALFNKVKTLDFGILVFPLCHISIVQHRQRKSQELTTPARYTLFFAARNGKPLLIALPFLAAN